MLEFRVKLWFPALEVMTTVGFSFSALVARVEFTLEFSESGLNPVIPKPRSCLDTRTTQDP